MNISQNMATNDRPSWLTPQDKLVDDLQMPFTEFTVRGTEIRPEVILDKRSFRRPSEAYIVTLAAYWRSDLEVRRPKLWCKQLSMSDLQTARSILRPDAETAFSLGTYLSGLDDELIHLTNRQIKVARRMVANPRTIVRGSAGTGKTVIALDRAKKLADSGKKVLYLCYNRYLADYIRKSMAGSKVQTAFDVAHAHSLYRKLIEDADLAKSLTSYEHEELFDRVFPELALEAIIRLDTTPWDAIIIDEAQDLLMPAHLNVLDLLLYNGLSAGCWHIFLDPMQNLFGSEIEAQIEKYLLESNPAIDDLFENCRSTKSIAIQTSIVSGIDVPIEGAIDGPESEIHYYYDHADCRDKIEDVLLDMLDRDVNPSDIVILSSRVLEKSCLCGLCAIAGRQIIFPDDWNIPDGCGILFSTIQSFKGLERKVVLAIDLEEIGEETWSMLHYAGLSRARTLLHVFLSRTNKERYAEQARAYGLRLGARQP